MVSWVGDCSDKRNLIERKQLLDGIGVWTLDHVDLHQRNYYDQLRRGFMFNLPTHIVTFAHTEF